MSSNHEKVIKNTVNSSTINDPWVTCDSTSHPGLKFYVNQRTGIKVWKITESEIEYAEKAATGGTEPQRRLKMNHPKNEKIYNKQVINNQFSNQLSNLLVNTLPVCSFNVWDNPQNLALQGQAHQSYTLVPTAVAEAYQRLIPLPTNVQNPSPQMPYNRKQNQPQRWTSQSPRPRYNKWKRNNDFTYSHNNTDLREKLVRRKSFNESLNENEDDMVNEKTCKWKENTLWEETSVQMSLAPLKFLTSSGSDSDQWYIVVDTDVILKNFNYLNNMAAADPDCHMLVPYHVMAELRTHVSESSNVQARRVLRFLTQQIESRLVKLGEIVPGESACHMTINTCVMLASQNSHVVLITSNTETFHYIINDENVHVFTMQDIKKILENRPEKIKLFRENSPTLALKIVVPNNAIRINVARPDTISASPSHRMDSTDTKYARDISETSSQRTFDSTELANDSQDIPRTTSRRIFDSTELGSDARDISGATSRTIFNATECANGNRDMSGMTSKRMFDLFERANDTRDISRRIFDATECANDTRDISGTNSQRSSVSSKVAIDAQDISGTTSQRDIHSIKCANDIRDISRTTFRRIINATDCANDTRDISGTTSRKHMDASKLANDTQDISERQRIIFDATECAKSSPGTNPRRSYVSTKVANNAQNISGAISQRDVHSIEFANDTRDSSGTNSQKSSVTTKVAIDARDISGATSRRIFNATACANDIRDKSGMTSQNIFGTTECANDTRDISRINSQTTINSTNRVSDAQDTPEAVSRRTINSVVLVNETQDISETVYPRNNVPINPANEAQDKTTSRITFDSSELDALTKISNDNWNQNLTNSSIQAKELAGTNVCTESPLKVQTGELYNPDCYRSPSKPVPKSGNEPFDTGKTKNLFGMLESSKKDFQSPAKISDRSSPCSMSSSTSGHVSLDTVRMKKIISMKRLTNTAGNLQKRVRKQPPRSISSNKSENSIISTGVLPQAINKPSVSRAASYDSIIEASGVGNVSENVIVEETSSSGVISNTNSESSHAVKARDPIQNKREKNTRKSVFMFDVACQSMEDILKTRHDEWLFRFVQIMEEVLRVKLQEKLPFEEKEYPAPRDLQEATTCIINKYIENFNIVNAANNLSFILYKTGDEKGKMADNIQPSDYMEMYSYGVFLVDTFLDMSAECKEKDCKKEKTSRTTEDRADSCSCYEVKAASESLKKLLYDIQNVNQETFVDHPHDIVTDNQDPDSDQYDYGINTSEENIMKVPEDMESPFDCDNWQCDDNETRDSYNLRAQRQRSESSSDLRPPRQICMETPEDDVSTIKKSVCKGVEVTFFNSLRLQKKDHGSDLKNDDKPNAIENKASHHATDQAQTTDGLEKEQNLHNIPIHFSKDNPKKSTCQTKVVRNFIVNPDIERKLKAKQNEKEYADDWDNEEANGDESIVCEQPTQHESEVCENNNQLNSESNKKSHFIKMLAHNLGIFFTKIKSLCNEYILISNEQSDTRIELHRKLEEWCARIGYIHYAFDSIIKREPSMSDDIPMLLKNIANVDCMPDDKFCLENWKGITTLKKTAEEFHNRIRRILNMGQGLPP